MWMVGIVTVIAFSCSPSGKPAQEQNQKPEDLPAQQRTTSAEERKAVDLLCRSGRSIAPIKSCDIEWNGILSISFALGIDDVDSMCRGISDIAKDNRATRVLHDEKWQLKVEDRDKKRTLCAF